MTEIKGFLETSFLDWPGKLCSVLFLPRCNFRCPYCHNHSLVLHPERYASIPWEEVLACLRSLRGWIDGVCLTGGEPTLEPDLLGLICELKGQGFLVKLDTNGSNPEVLENVVKARAVDFISMDVKAPLDPLHYRRATGVPIEIDPILKSIELLKRGEVDYEFRMTVVSALHSEEDILKLGEELRVGPRFVLQNFNPADPLDQRLRQVPPYDRARLKRLEREVQAMR